MSLQFPRRAPRIKDPALMSLLKYEYDECEITGQTADLHLHHVIFKSHGGDDLRENIICLYSPLHEAYHRGDLEAKMAVAAHVNDPRSDVAAYISEKLGGASALLFWFERHGL